ncbi:glutamate racemase [bacterium]|jgi:glutamate racemase|nr:glutamate racemase [bacterium]MBT7311584.1 glutamate racemase [bacterium]
MGPIGVFDSGMGGLTVLRELHRRLPAEDLLYFGDTARVPYGTKGARTVREFALQDALFLRSRGVKMIVVACNTASAFAIDYLQEQLDVPVLGVIKPGVQAALEKTAGGNIGVIATRGTVSSNRYQELLIAEVGKDRVIAKECPLFVPLVEEGMTSGNVTDLVTADYLQSLKNNVDTLILGCTHYPLLKETIANFMGDEVKLVDSAEALAEAAASELENKKESGSGEISFCLSDIPWKFREVGARFLGKPIDAVETVNLNELEREGVLSIPRKEKA